MPTIALVLFALFVALAGMASNLATLAMQPTWPVVVGYGPDAYARAAVLNAAMATTAAAYLFLRWRRDRP